MPGEIFEPFSIVVVPFPTERPVTKRRPALVVSSLSFNSAHDHLILAMITAARHSAWPSDIALSDWAAAGLSVPCRVRLKLFTLPRGLIERRTGILAEPDRAQVANALGRSLIAA